MCLLVLYLPHAQAKFATNYNHRGDSSFPPEFLETKIFTIVGFGSRACTIVASRVRFREDSISTMLRICRHRIVGWSCPVIAIRPLHARAATRRQKTKPLWPLAAAGYGYIHIVRDIWGKPKFVSHLVEVGGGDKQRGSRSQVTDHYYPFQYN